MVDRPPEETDEWDRAREEAVRERLTSPRATEVEKALAAVVGAAEGFLEEAQRADLPHLAGRAVQRTEDTYREISSTREEMRGMRRETPAAEGAGAVAQPIAVEGPEGAEVDGRTAKRAEELLERAQDYVRAVEDSSRRALEAPTAIKSHAKVTAKEVGTDLAWSAGWGGLAMGLGFAALILLGITATILLSFFLGPFVSALLVTLVYAAAAGGVAYMAYKKALEARADAKTGVTKVQGEVREIAKPMRAVRRQREVPHQ